MSRSIFASSCRLWLPALVLTVISAQAPAMAAEPSDAPEAHYRVLEWNDLVPDGWEPPLVSRAYDEVSAAKVDWNSVVQELEGQLAALPGYVEPIVYDGNRVSEFLLVPFRPYHTNAHTPLEPNQMVYVYALEPVVVDRPFDPVWVVGAITLEALMTDEGPAAYRMVDAVTTRYEY